MKDGLPSGYYWTSAKCAFSYAEELGVPYMVCQGIIIGIVNFLKIFFFSHFFENALLVLWLTSNKRDLCLGLNILMFCKAQMRKCKKKLVFCFSIKT